MKTIPSTELTISVIPGASAADIEITCFAQTLNGYTEVGREAGELGKYLRQLDGGDGKYQRRTDAEMRKVTGAIRKRVERGI